MDFTNTVYCICLPISYHRCWWEYLGQHSSPWFRESQENSLLYSCVKYVNYQQYIFSWIIVILWCGKVEAKWGTYYSPVLHVDGMTPNTTNYVTLSNLISNLPQGCSWAENVSCSEDTYAGNCVQYLYFVCLSLSPD